jgi:hypothetical protein
LGCIARRWAPCRATSDRFCSPAIRIFFEGQVERSQRPSQCLNATVGLQMSLQLPERSVRMLGDKGANAICFSRTPRRATPGSRPFDQSELATFLLDPAHPELAHSKT